MDFVEYLLRKFSFVRGLERGVRRLEKSVLDLTGERGRLEAENRGLRGDLERWGRFCAPGHYGLSRFDPVRFEAANRREALRSPLLNGVARRIHRDRGRTHNVKEHRKGYYGVRVYVKWVTENRVRFQESQAPAWIRL